MNGVRHAAHTVGCQIRVTPGLAVRKIKLSFLTSQKACLCLRFRQQRLSEDHLTSEEAHRVRQIQPKEHVKEEETEVINPHYSAILQHQLSPYSTP